MILSVTLTTVLLLSISLIFSSFHKYIEITTLKQNNYHVYFESQNFKKPSYVKIKIYQNKKVYLKYKNVYKIKQNTKKICKKIKCKNIIYNNKILSLYGLSNNSTLKLIKNILLTILIILGTSTFILIKNSFNITLIERKKELGILKSVGMTKKQILISLLEETTIILIISLLIGTIISIWFIQIMLFIINSLLKEIIDTKIILTFYLPFITVSIIFIVIVFYLSTLIPIIKTNKQNIITLLKENETFKKKKIPKIIYHLKPIKRLAFSNYYRLKKKYRPIKLSVLISVILYISFALYLKYGLSSINQYVDIPKYDFFISVKGTEENSNKLKSFSKKYKKYKIYSTCTIKGKIDKTSYLNKIYNQDNIIVIKSKKEGVINYIKTDKEKNKKYLKNKIILNIGSAIKLNAINNIPFGLENIITKGNVALLSNNFNNYCKDYSLNVYIKDKRNITKDLNKLKIKDEITYIDVKKATRLTQNFSLALKFSLYSVQILVIFISISLISSTFRLIVYIREKEIGTLKSIGITDFNLKKLLLIESNIILFKTFIWIIPISYLVSYSLFKDINKTIATNLIIPKEEIIISFIVTFIVLYYSLTSNYNKIKNKPIIQMINKENI